MIFAQCLNNLFNFNFKKILMKTQNIFFSFLAIVLAFGITFSTTSCTKKDAATPKIAPTVTVEFDNVAGSADLTLGTDYTNSSGEVFKISKFTYYISNVSLTKTDGSVFKVAQDDSYFLIKEDVAASQMVELKGVPEGDYKSITFTVGVDSVRNCAPIDKRTGALDPANGMYWTWNSGYIFSMLEGSSNVSTATDKVFQFHVGGFGGYTAPVPPAVNPNNIRIVTVPFIGAGQEAQVAKVRSNTETELHLNVDALKVFGVNANGVDNRVSIAATPTVMGSPAVRATAKILAGNYQNNVFGFSHIHTMPK